MKRASVGIVVAVGLALAVTWWLLRPAHGPRTGAWHGVTTQRLPIEFFVARADDGLFIDEWQVRLDLRCEESGRVIHGLVFGGTPISIRDGRFSERLASTGLWHDWNGTFTSDNEVHGGVRSVWPSLTGTTFEQLGTEKCTVPELAWEAHPGKDDEAATAAPADIAIRIERDRRGKILISH
jgi:hypothetical protein